MPTKTSAAVSKKGLTACNTVLGRLKAANFIRYAEGFNKHVGCTFPSNADRGTTAAVCKPDLTTRTIAITPTFCELPINKKIFKTPIILLGDSQILTLVHEVTHFNDTFASLDTWYGSKNSLDHVALLNSAALLTNADSLASYMIGVDETTR